MKTVLIIGASRGIGQHLAQQYVRDGWRVLATARQADACAALSALGAEAHQLDVTDAAACRALAATLDGVKLDVALLNAGVYGPREDGFAAQEEFDAVMHTNVLAAIRLLPILAPAVCAAQGKLAVLSSHMGSLSERVNVGGTMYRASKAALNSVLIDTALRFGVQGATCVALHPGWVRTEMGGPQADLSPEESASGIRSTLAALANSSKAAFLNYDGKSIGW